MKPKESMPSIMYAETDLDQPTDYSLRYAEDDSELVSKALKQKTEYIQDTIKTYCTEDTPYETPFNFSTSTSMFDLREVEPDKKPAIEEHPAKPSQKKVPRPKSAFSSGLMSPDKPVNYCDEGTPGYFSRVDSCSSLNLIDEGVKKDTDRLEREEDAPLPDGERMKPPKAPTRLKFSSDSAPKAIKFEEVVNYAEETPLMFSRSSSLASLDSIEQHSIHDDRSSVVSDFSRLTSGVISPSELPDSPTQSSPKAPRLLFAKSERKETKETSVFEDGVTKFKTESTPLEFSAATSLSSLLLHDLDETPLDSAQGESFSDTIAGSSKKSIFKLKLDAIRNDATSDSLRTYCTEDTPAILSHAGSNSDLRLLAIVGNECKIIDDELIHEMNDEGILDAQIDANIAVSTRKNSKFNNFEDKLDKSRLPSRLSTNNLIKLSDNYGGDLEKEREGPSGGDSIKNYFTEDTPAILSNAGSNSDLSVLSMPTLNECIIDRNINKDEDEDDDYFLDLNSTVSDDDEDDDDLLTECVRFGMATTTAANLNNQISNQNSNNITLNNYLPTGTLSSSSAAGTKQKVDLNISLESNETDHDDNESIQSSISSLSDDSNESEAALLQECILAGMPAKTQPNPPSPPSPDEETNDLTSAEKALLHQCILDGMKSCSIRPRKSDESEESSELTAAEKSLLKQCILAGMPKNRNLAAGGPSRRQELDETLLQECVLAEKGESNDLTSAEKALLHQCILDGMKSCSIRPRKSDENEESSELTAAEKALLNQCILAGMPKKRGCAGPSKQRDSAELNETERMLLQQCILAGMPKSKPKSNNVHANKQLLLRKISLSREKEGEKSGGEHGCCMHCPKSQKNVRQQNGAGSRVRRKSRGDKGAPGSANKEFLFVTNQMLARKKELTSDRVHEEWV